MSSERILVTGAGGFLGSEVVRQLRAEGRTVRAMVRSTNQAEELRKTGAEVVIADLKDREAVTAATQGISSVIHIAALFRQAGLPESEFYQVNVEGTRWLLDAAIAAGATRFIHCSTVGVHGDIENPPANENCPYSPGDMYQRSKTEGEQLVLRYFSENRINGAVIRPGMIYGPHDRRTLKLFKMVSQGRFFYIGSGNALVHFVDVRDVALGFRLALDNHDVKNEVFIIAGPQSLPLRAFVSDLCEALQIKRPWLHLPVKPLQLLGTICEAICTPLRIDPPIYRRRVDFYTKNRSFDCSKANRILGYTPTQNSYGELSDIINSYIAEGLIKGEPLSKPCTITRNIDGHIEHIDPATEHMYGVKGAAVLGKVSHSVLQTIFPRPLDQINNQLREQGKWAGNLVHRTASGEEVSVFSCWELKTSASGQPIVVETNRLRLKGKGVPCPTESRATAPTGLVSSAT
jgi:dihydroflavonol-4-reductase